MRAALAERCENIQRKAQQLQREEDQEQILRAHKQHHARSRKQRDSKEFADMRRERGSDRHEHDKNGQDKQGDLNQLYLRAKDESSIEYVRLLWIAQYLCDCANTADSREDSSRGEAGAR